jgi:hypothetical protein
MNELFECNKTVTALCPTPQPVVGPSRHRLEAGITLVIRRPWTSGTGAVVDPNLSSLFTFVLLLFPVLSVFFLKLTPSNRSRREKPIIAEVVKKLEGSLVFTRARY